MIDFTALMGTAQKQSWALVAFACAVDTSTPTGEAMANMLATFAQFERRLISRRTKEALAVKRASGVGSAARRRCRRLSSAGFSGSGREGTRCARSPMR